MEDRTTIFIVDDSRDMRQSLKWLLESSRLRVETFASALEFLGEYERGRRGCLVVDVRMPGMSGLRLLETLRDDCIFLPTIVVSAYSDVKLAVQAMKLGAVTFLEKPYDFHEILREINTALQEDVRMHSTWSEQKQNARRLARLTPREAEVLHLLVKGLRNKVIASELQISDRTVENHRARIMEKLEVSSLAELVHIALVARQEASSWSFASSEGTGKRILV